MTIEHGYMQLTSIIDHTLRLVNGQYRTSLTGEKIRDYTMENRQPHFVNPSNLELVLFFGFGKCPNDGFHLPVHFCVN